ncbi:unnamed protein product [Toxocara canis]|uniref:Probable U3 small nucleolar RNA-associated protein 11 n=1 Tax=Toxocara canis TaxID=6265 RepID=A0A183U104_TOXCA|nr:unnamed protein product [Toxocara canis]
MDDKNYDEEIWQGQFMLRRPEARAHLGHLEKRKDYLQRAKDYNEKKEKLRKLKREALDRNPDEFHFHMVRSRIAEDGMHHELTPEPDEDTKLQKKLADVKDLKYVRHRLNIENKVAISLTPFTSNLFCMVVGFNLNDLVLPALEISGC